MRIYIASSFRNLHAVRMLQEALRTQGHTVLDWSSLAPPLAENMSPEARRLALDADDRGEIFKFCTDACRSVDLVIYLGTSGQDAACEVGIAFAVGIPILGLAAPTEKPGTILARAVRWYKGVPELLDAVGGQKKSQATSQVATGNNIVQAVGNINW